MSAKVYTTRKGSDHRTTTATRIESSVRFSTPPRSKSVSEQIMSLLPEAGPATAADYDWAVEQFYEALYKFAFGLAGSESDAADLTQDTYRVLLTKGDAIRDARKVKSWLFTTLYRQFLGQRRHASRFPETPVESAQWELPPITPQQAEALDGSFVVAALQQLEEKYRAPLAMFYLEELSYKEMAEVLDLPIGTIMSRMSRGKEILRKRLQAPSAVAINRRQVGSPSRWQSSNVVTVA